MLLLERLIAYERVHPMAGWWDLRRRLGPHRRVFAFVHPRMGAEPLVFVQAALLPRVATHLYQVLPKEAPLEPLDCCEEEPRVTRAHRLLVVCAPSPSTSQRALGADLSGGR